MNFDRFNPLSNYLYSSGNKIHLPQQQNSKTGFRIDSADRIKTS